MHEFWKGIVIVTLAGGLAGCGAAPTVEAPQAANVDAHEHGDAGHADADTAERSEAAPVTSLAPIDLPPFSVTVDRLGEVTDGHFNIYVKGGEVAAVRAWVGDEAATNAFIGKAEWEDTHHCAHLEFDGPPAADARFWVELETADGATLKGSTAL